MTDIKLRTFDDGTTTFDGEALGALRAGLRGQVLTQGAPGYDEARTIWNAMIDRKPGIIIRCQNASSQSAVFFGARGQA